MPRFPAPMMTMRGGDAENSGRSGAANADDGLAVDVNFRVRSHGGSIYVWYRFSAEEKAERMKGCREDERRKEMRSPGDNRPRYVSTDKG